MAGFNNARLQLLLHWPNINTFVVAVQLLCHDWLFVTPQTSAKQASLSFTISPSLLKLMSIELVMSSNHPILYGTLLLLPSIFPSIKVFFNELTLSIRWPKYWSFSISISPSNEDSGLISSRIDWVYLLTVEGHLRVFFCTTVQKHVLQLLHPHMTTGKNIVLTRGTFVDKVMSLLFNILSGLS